jgi:hypothetical protein
MMLFVIHSEILADKNLTEWQVGGVDQPHPDEVLVSAEVEVRQCLVLSSGWNNLTPCCESNYTPHTAPHSLGAHRGPPLAHLSPHLNPKTLKYVEVKIEKNRERDVLPPLFSNRFENKLTFPGI